MKLKAIAQNSGNLCAIAGMEILYSEENGKFSHCDRMSDGDAIMLPIAVAIAFGVRAIALH